MEDYASSLPTEGQSFRRIEVLSGPVGRRRWSDEEKAAIVAESFVPGAVTRRVALRRGVHPNQLYAWRRELAPGRVVGKAVSPFVPVTVASATAETTGGGKVEIEVGGVLVRVSPGVDEGLLGAVLRVVKSA